MTGADPTGTPPEPRTLVIANPSSDVYGSDLQMLESVTAMVERGWKVIVTTPDDGPLVPLLTERGAEVQRVDYPVVRRENTSLRGFLRLAVDTVTALPRVCRAIRAVDPTVIYVNTVTIPLWVLAGRLMRRPVVCHVHEAEAQDRRLVRFALNAPLVMASRLIVISQASMKALTDVIPMLGRRAVIIYNGVPGPDVPPSPPTTNGPRRLAIIGRLSPRKGTDVALETLARLRAAGRDVVLEVCGTAFAGYEWYVEELKARSDKPDIRGAVHFSGYVRPVWSVLDRCEVVLAPSLREPFGNVVVEAQLAGRPVVAAAAMGHLETVEDGVTGLLVEPGNPESMAAAVGRLLDEPDLASDLARRAREQSVEHFAPGHYGQRIAELLSDPSGEGRRRGQASRRRRSG
ncbi:glycosyltransferase family 4 protein [Nakamurella sp.]|uniref:glycosyltransferase family 4 protein n=1 Tax=Nakamurella sp. TaxID=1869182 RepID=UPI003B3B6BCF